MRYTRERCHGALEGVAVISSAAISVCSLSPFAGVPATLASRGGLTGRGSRPVSVAPLVQAHMPSTLSAAAAAVVALLFWTVLGLSISRRILPHALALPLAPSLGWAVHSAAGLVLFLLFGFSAVAVAVFATVAAITSIASLFQKIDGPAPEGTVPPWAYVAAAVLALAPAAAVVPEHLGQSVVVASPIYDHAKVAIIDAITRLGLPPANPFFGEFGEPGRLAYYYLWYFSGAQLAALLGLTGWEADIALTWFSAFSSLSLMMGLALWFGRRSAPVWALLFAATGSLRLLLGSLLGAQGLDGLLAHPTGFAGWLYQSAWVPQHLMSASCVVLAVLLMSRLAAQRNASVFLALVLVVVAGFESSTWIGGITFLLAAFAATLVLLIQIPPLERWRLALWLAGAAALSVVLAAPFVLDQVADVAARSSRAPVAIGHFPVLGDWFAEPIRSLLDYPAYWLVLLPVEMPATYVAGRRCARHVPGLAQARPATATGRYGDGSADRRWLDRLVAHGQHARRDQRPRFARGTSGGSDPHHLCSRGVIRVDCQQCPHRCRCDGLRSAARVARGSADRLRQCDRPARASPAAHLRKRPQCGPRCAATPGRANGLATIRFSWRT